jgi:hypothetical protein
MALASIADLNGPTEEVTLRIDQAKKLSAMYDDFIALDQDDGSARPPGIHASEMYPCLRKPVYSVMDVPKRPNVAKFWKQRFKVGAAIHRMLQTDFHKMAGRSRLGKMMRTVTNLAEDIDCLFEFEDEVPVSPAHQEIAAYYKLYSHADGIFTFKDRTTGETVLRIGLEAKTMSPGEYEKLTKPKEEHVRQAHIYMGCLDLPLMWFLYMNKGNQNNTASQAPYLQTFQPSIWAELVDRMQVIHAFAERNELPERTETVVCDFCPWSYTCQPKNKTSSASQSQAHTRKESIRSPGK